MNCPVCEKAGLPDFTKSAIVCSQCNSDLKAYMLISELKNRKIDSTKKPILKRILIAFGLILIGSFASYLFFNSFEKVGEQKNSQTNSLDTLNFYKAENQKLLLELQNIGTKNTEIKYIVKRGDNLSQISNFFYNDFNAYQKIISNNKLINPSLIKAGDTLFITLDSE